MPSANSISSPPSLERQDLTESLYLRPIALADSPQSEDGEAVRLAGGPGLCQAVLP